MPNKTKKKEGLKELFTQKLQAIYDYENEITKALPKMAKAATDPKLKQGFEHHLDETKGQIERLEESFELIGEKPKKLAGDAIRGLAKDGEWVIKNVEKGDSLDANLAAAARYVEHYEMAGYMAAIEWANKLGEDEIASLLEENRAEEEHTDKELEKMGSTILKRLD